MAGNPEQLDPMRGSIRWAWARGWRHLDRFLIGVVVFAAAGAVISHFLTGQPYLVALLAILVAVLVAFGWAVIRASYEQRDTLRKELGALRDAVDQYSLGLEQFELEVTEGPPRGSLVVGLYFRNHLALPLSFRVEKFTQRIGDARLFLGPSTEIVVIPPGDTTAYRLTGDSRFELVATERHDIEVEYSVVYGVPGIAKRYRRVHNALVRHRPRLDVPHTFVSPPAYNDLFLEVTQLGGGDEVLVGQGVG